MTKNFGLPAIFSNRVNDMERWIGDVNSVFLDMDRMFDDFNRVFPSSVRALSFPPVNLTKTNNGYEVVMAVAGFTKDDISVELSTDGVLTVSGKTSTEENTETTFLFKGIAARQFTRKWQLLDTDEVTDVTLTNGLLTITIKRNEPNAPTTRLLTINTK